MKIQSNEFKEKVKSESDEMDETRAAINKSAKDGFKKGISPFQRMAAMSPMIKAIPNGVKSMLVCLIIIVVFGIWKTVELIIGAGVVTNGWSWAVIGAFIVFIIIRETWPWIALFFVKKLLWIQLKIIKLTRKLRDKRLKRESEKLNN